MFKITNSIRRLRFDHGEMTQQQLAEQVGVTRQTIIALEAGKYTPSLALAFHLAHGLAARSRTFFSSRWSPHDAALSAARLPRVGWHAYAAVA